MVRHLTRNDRLKIWKRDGGICQLCLAPVAFDRNMHADHIAPLILGGCDHLENLRTTHGRCNQRRRDGTPGAPHCPIGAPRLRGGCTGAPRKPRKVRGDINCTSAQWAWLQERAARTGSVSIAPVVRMVIQEAMDAEAKPEEGEAA